MTTHDDRSPSLPQGASDRPETRPEVMRQTGYVHRIAASLCPSSTYDRAAVPRIDGTEALLLTVTGISATRRAMLAPAARASGPAPEDREFFPLTRWQVISLYHTYSALIDRCASVILRLTDRPRPYEVRRALVASPDHLIPLDATGPVGPDGVSDLLHFIVASTFPRAALRDLAYRAMYLLDLLYHDRPEESLYRPGGRDADPADRFREAAVHYLTLIEEAPERFGAIDWHIQPDPPHLRVRQLPAEWPSKGLIKVEFLTHDEEVDA